MVSTLDAAFSEFPEFDFRVRYTHNMRVLLSVYSCSPGYGSEPGVGWNWALALARRGHEVYAVTRERHRIDIENALAQLPEKRNLNFLYHATNWPKGHFASGVMANIAYSRWQKSMFPMIKEQHARTPFDVVHHLTFSTWRQPSRIWRLGVPFVFGPIGGAEEAPFALTGNFDTKARFAEIARIIWNRLSLVSPELRRSLKCAVSVPAKTKEMAGIVRRMGGTTFLSSELGIDVARVIPHIRKRQEGPLRFIFAGRLINWKGIRYAIDAVEKANRTSDITLNIVGEGKMSALLRAEVEARGLSKIIRFVGPVSQSQIFDIYRQHDVMLFPSLHDSGGTVVLEALASGLPVVCLDLGGPGEMVSPSNGVAVDVQHLDIEGTVAALAEALLMLERDETLRQRLATGAIETARAMSWDAAVARVYEPLEQLDACPSLSTGAQN